MHRRVSLCLHSHSQIVPRVLRTCTPTSITLSLTDALVERPGSGTRVLWRVGVWLSVSHFTQLLLNSFFCYHSRGGTSDGDEFSH